MDSIIRELYFGNLSGQDDSFDRNSEYGKVIKAVADHEENVIKFLSEEEKEIFFAFVKAQGNLSSVETADKFVMGFIIGSKIMLEIMESKCCQSQ